MFLILELRYLTFWDVLRGCRTKFLISFLKGLLMTELRDLAIEIKTLNINDLDDIINLELTIKFHFWPFLQFRTIDRLCFPT